MNVMKASLTKVIFDCVGIDVKGVQVMVMPRGSLREVDYRLHDDLNPNLGHALEVMLPDALNLATGDRLMVKISYNTNNESLAINWLKPSQTAGK